MTVEELQVAFLQHLKDIGLEPRDPAYVPLVDTQGPQRFRVNDGDSGTACHYMLWSSGKGWYQDMRNKLTEGLVHWSCKGAPKLTPDELAAIKEDQQAAREEARIAQGRARLAVEGVYRHGTEVPAEHPYLSRKGVKPLGSPRMVLHEKSGHIALFVPFRDIRGKIWGGQFIHDDGDKEYVKGARKQGLFHLLGDPPTRADPFVFVAEGYATGCTVNELTKTPVAVAGDSVNLKPVAQEIKRGYPFAQIYFAADDDWLKTNDGYKKACDACRAIGENHEERVVVPEFDPLLREDKDTDFNDLAARESKAVAATQLQDALPKELGSDTEFDIVRLLGLDIEAERLEHTLLGPSWLDEKSGLLIVGPTGSGKSVLATQGCIRWSQGKAYLGISANRPLRILVCQAEDGELDAAEMLQGCIVHNNANHQDTNLDLVRQNVRIRKINGLTNEALMTKLAKIHRKFPFDIVILNPVFSFAKGNLKDQEVVQHFCRNLLDPFMEKHDCSVILVGHTPKPTKIDKETVRQDTEYAIFGSVEWPNWARATLEIVKTTTKNVFKLVGGKRRDRIGWVDDQGAPLHEIYVKYAEDRLEWLHVDPDDLEDDADPANNGSPKRGHGFPLQLIKDALLISPAPASVIRDRLGERFGFTDPELKIPSTNTLFRRLMRETKKENPQIGKQEDRFYLV